MSPGGSPPARRAGGAAAADRVGVGAAPADSAGIRRPADGARWSSARIRRLRPARAGVAPDRALAHAWETERRASGGERRALTVFLAGAECPFTCLFCDLWRHTLETPTAPGAIPAQLARALEEAGPAPGGSALKLYNASNFFDRRAVPPADDARIAALCRGFEHVTVECHPRLLGERAERFGEAIDGRLEVAMGLETVHPDVFPRLNKGMTREDFDDAVAWARERRLGTRAFVLIGLPWVPAVEFASWAAASAGHAARLGVDRVSLIPLRPGNGALDALARGGELEPVRLEHVEDALAGALAAAGPRTVVEADPWDLERLATCADCGPRRIERLRWANLAQTAPPPVPCACRE